MPRVLTFVFLVVSAASAQEAPQPQASAPPPGARYEIVPCYTPFRLDRFTGHVDGWRSDQNGGSRWVVLEVPGLPVADGLPRFQISCPSFTAYTIFLLDTVTGLTWNWAPDRTRSGQYSWLPFIKE